VKPVDDKLFITDFDSRMIHKIIGLTAVKDGKTRNAVAIHRKAGMEKRLRNRHRDCAATPFRIHVLLSETWTAAFKLLKGRIIYEKTILEFHRCSREN
jgi:hypothetical protein